MASNIASYGKVRYIEPNNIKQDKLYGEWKVNNNGEKYLHSEAYNIPHDLEDYCISVDLIVTIPKRIGNAKTENKSHTVSIISQGENISFLGGTDGLMTNTPGSTTYYDILNKDLGGTQESLGITNIHIAYNSYFYPEVTINFTDIRGAALMMPHEENYRRKKINQLGGQEHYDSTVENFFAALFSFPYPDFKLQVKGFYGKMVEYNLVVSDFRSSFNSQTGNFDATVKFIGKMYGVYTDIPMSYLLMAPYCKYGSVNNQSIWEQHADTFVLPSNIPMPTLLELRERVVNAHYKLTTDMNYDKVKEYTSAQKRLTALENIKFAYKKMISHLKNKYGSIKTSGVILGQPFNEDLHLFLYNEEKCSYLYDNNSELLTYTQSLYDLITDYNNSDYVGTKIPYLGELNERQSKIGEGGYAIPTLRFWKAGDDINVLSSNIVRTDFFSKINSTTPVKLSELKRYGANNGGFPTVFEGVEKYLKSTITNGVSVPFAALICTDFVDAIKKIEKETKNLISKLKKEIDSEYGARLESLLGFTPSIRNVFKIVMAHLQTFIEVYAAFLNNVTGANTRKLNQYGLSFDNTDVPDRGGKFSDTDLPPFPAIINKISNEYAYPTGIVSRTMEETNLIDSFFDSAFTVLQEKKKSDEEIDELRDESLEFIPTCLSDLTTLSNPYEYTFSNNEGTIDVDWIMTFLGIRCMTRFISEQTSDGKTSEEFGKCEAYNFWRRNKSLSEETIKKIKSSDFSDSNFIKFLQGEEDCPYITNKKPCYSSNVGYYDTTAKAYKNHTITNLLLPTIVAFPSEFNMPASIGRNFSGFDTYIADTDKTRVPEYAYSSTGKVKVDGQTMYVPYHYIQLIKPNVLKEWNNKVNSADLSKFIDDEKKKMLLENRLALTKNLFRQSSVRYVEKNAPANDFFKVFAKKSDTFEGAKYLQDFYNEDLKVTFILNSISNVEDKPIFFEDNLTADKFLCTIPHNLQTLFDELTYGKRCITMPYVTQLFLGMCIKFIKEDKFDTILNKLAEEWGDITHKYDIKNYLHFIIYKFLLYKDGTMNICTRDINYVKNSLTLDYLGLQKKYETWANSTSPGGFQHIKTMYSFKGSNHLATLKSACKQAAGTDYTKVKETQKIFNDNFKWVNRDISAISSATDFTDRYNQISYNEDGTVKLSFNTQFETYKELFDLFASYSILVFPYNVKNETFIANITDFQSAFNGFKNTVLELYKKTDPETGEDNNVDYGQYSSSLVTDESKLSMYLTLKNLQDKHFSNLNNEKEQYNIAVKDSEWDRFHFIDTFYNDIGDDLILNANQIEELIGNIMTGYESGTGEGIVQSQMSVYSFMAKLCQDSNTMLMALPVFNGSFIGTEGEQNLEDMFRPIPYDEITSSYKLKGPSYVCFYPHQPSKHLDIANAQYANDGFCISNDMNDNTNYDDLNNTANFLGPTSVPDLYPEDTKNGNSYIIPAFGVEYGIQNQSIFKNVNVNMDNPMVTEYSVAAQFNIAQGKQTEERKLAFEGQNLFDIYSNHSYTCQVEMMGCAQIQPLMYFQLNNIPMFRGAYQIINVEHNITPGDMSTTFKGVRINKNKIPMVKTCLNLNSMLDAMNGKTPYDAEKNKQQASTFTDNLITANLGDDGMDAIPSDVNYTFDKCKEDLGSAITIAEMDSHPNKIQSFNELNPSLRRLVYAITKEMQKNNKGINITSATRVTSKFSPYSKSDHSIGKMIDGKWVFRGNLRREKLKGIDGYDVEKKYSEMGCAVDMQGILSNGSVDKTNASIPLYHLIATQFTNNIRQLVWEIRKGYSTSEDCISNCVHLASYGAKGKDGNDKCEVFVSTQVGDDWPAILANNKKDISKAPTNLPPMFIKTLYDMAKLGKLSGVSLINFTNAGLSKGKITEELLKSWCEQLGV